MSIYYFSKNCFVMKHSGGTKSRFIFENPIFSRKSNFFFFENPIFSLENPSFFLENIRNSGGCPCTNTTFRKHTKSGVWSLSEFPCFIVYACITYLQYLTQCGVKPGLYSIRRSTQTELRKQIYADTRVMAFILLRRSRRVCTHIVGVFILGICTMPMA